MIEQKAEYARKFERGEVFPVASGRFGVSLKALENLKAQADVGNGIVKKQLDVAKKIVDDEIASWERQPAVAETMGEPVNNYVNEAPVDTEAAQRAWSEASGIDVADVYRQIENVHSQRSQN